MAIGILNHRTRRSSAPHRGRIELDNVSMTYGTGAAASTALAPASLDIDAGSFVCLLGPSGCGKSTLLNCVAGYIWPTTGRARVDGAAIDAPGPDRGMVFQQYSLFPWKTVRENVAFGPRMTGASRREAREVADRLLEMVGLSRVARKYPAELSGGMQQRVGIARALANQPDVLLMDEPFGALDSQTRLIMQEHLLALWAEFRPTILFVTHDTDEAIFLADRVLLLSASPGQVLADIAIDLPRPRPADIVTDPAFIAIKRRCLATIRAESLKTFDGTGFRMARIPDSASSAGEHPS